MNNAEPDRRWLRIGKGFSPSKVWSGGFVPGMMDSGIRGDARRTYLLYMHGLELPSSWFLAPSLQQKVTPTVYDLHLPLTTVIPINS